MSTVFLISGESCWVILRETEEGELVTEERRMSCLIYITGMQWHSITYIIVYEIEYARYLRKSKKKEILCMKTHEMKQKRKR